jgi:hypothetical protein
MTRRDRRFALQRVWHAVDHDPAIDLCWMLNRTAGTPRLTVAALPLTLTCLVSFT